MEPIGKIIKKITDATSKENMETSANTDRPSSKVFDQKKCPICGGIGYVRRDLPVDHPDFGLLEVCSCQKQAVQAASIQRLYQISNLEAFKQMTFESFSLSGRDDARTINKTLEVACNTARNYAHHLNGWLLLLGAYGCGKTHLAAAIANEVIKLSVPTLFLTVPDLLDWLRYSYGSEDTTFEQRFEEIRNIRFLVLDDLGTQNTTSWAREKLYQIINHRYIHRLPTVITSNLSLKEIDERISSRLQDRELVVNIQIDASDYRNPLADGQDSPIASLAMISDHRTFDNFNTRKNEKLSPDEHDNIERAFYLAQQFADKPNGWLVFMGGFGTGKTHLAAAIGHYRAALGEEPIFSIVPDLLDYLRATYSPSSTVSYDSVFAQVRNTKLLILDDLGTQNATPWAREKLYQILNYRYEAFLPTVLTTSASLEEIDARIRSRIMDERICTIFKIIVPPYRVHAPKKRGKSA